jgi:hypothetical protein
VTPHGYVGLVSMVQWPEQCQTMSKSTFILLLKTPGIPFLWDKAALMGVGRETLCIRPALSFGEGMDTVANENLTTSQNRVFKHSWGFCSTKLRTLPHWSSGKHTCLVHVSCKIHINVTTTCILHAQIADQVS